MCGLPLGVHARFDPNPAVSLPDLTTTTGGAAHTRLHLLTDSWVTPATYSLALHAVFQNPAGQLVDAPGGGALNPIAVTLGVTAPGQATLQPLSPIPAVGLQGCSALPSGFTGPATSTPVAGPLTIIPYVSNPHPRAGDLQTVYGALLQNGKGVPSVVMHTIWYFPDAMHSCDGITGAAGIASCSLVEGQELPNQTVQIQLIFDYNGQQYTGFVTYTT